MRKQAFKTGIAGTVLSLFQIIKEHYAQVFRENCQGGNRNERAQNGIGFKVKRRKGKLLDKQGLLRITAFSRNHYKS